MTKNQNFKFSFTFLLIFQTPYIWNIIVQSVETLVTIHKYSDFLKKICNCKSKIYANQRTMSIFLLKTYISDF